MLKITETKGKTDNILIPYMRNLSEKLTTIFGTSEVGTYNKPCNTIRSIVVNPKDKSDKKNMK